METETKPQQENENTTVIEKKRKLNKPVLYGLIALIAVAVGYSIYHAAMFQTTDDAYIETTTVQVAPKVSGQVVDVFITDNQHVKEGDLVARIDDTDYKIALEQANAKYERTLLNQKNAKANFSAAQSEIDLAKVDLERYKKLYEAGAVSKQTLDSAQTKYDNVSAKLTTADEALLSNNDNKVADAELKEIKAMKDKAAINLSYTNIYAPQAGTVANRRVERGMYVQTGAPLFVIVPDNVWVIANFKENQLGGMKPGQPVDIKVDAYPKKVFKAKIDSIQRSSGAKSSLFPPENAVGSFVKIVQRIPVKIIFTETIDPSEYTIVPGMSVIPKVRVK